MQRSYSTQALILNLKPVGENNCNVTILTPDKGILYVTLYGGPKSKMRSVVTQWNCGKIWLYENPEKNQTKISDFELKTFHQTFSQNLFKLYAASLATELTIKTHCAGSNEKAFLLLNGFLDGMELCNEEQSRLGLLRFLWRYLSLLGVQPDTSCCGQCAKKFFSTKFATEKNYYYIISENYFICDECHIEEDYNQNTIQIKKSDFGKVSSSSLFYLYGITNLLPKDARNIKINKNGYEQLKQLVFFLIENNAGCKLNSIETSMGIL